MRSKNVLLAPLDWGLGHATRCIPVIKSILSLGHNPIICGSGLSYAWLKNEMPELPFVDLANYHITYPAKGSFHLHFAKQLTGMNRFISKEHSLVKKVIDRFNIDAIISDNRYGLYDEKIPAALITHQLQPQIGKARILIQPMINRYLNRFHQVWVPDRDDHAMSGGLSEVSPGIRNEVIFIGPLSRFRSNKGVGKFRREYNVLAILSGPEPSRTLFEEMILSQLKNVPGNHVIVRGNDASHESVPENIQVENFPGTERLKVLIESSQNIICRAGYSGIMDLAALGRNAILVPTPGQPEQEYLAGLESIKKHFLVKDQEDLLIARDIGKLEGLETIIPLTADSALTQTIENFLS